MDEARSPADGRTRPFHGDRGQCSLLQRAGPGLCIPECDGRGQMLGGPSGKGRCFQRPRGAGSGRAGARQPGFESRPSSLQLPVAALTVTQTCGVDRVMRSPTVLEARAHSGGVCRTPPSGPLRAVTAPRPSASRGGGRPSLGWPHHLHGLLPSRPSARCVAACRVHPADPGRAPPHETLAQSHLQTLLQTRSHSGSCDLGVTLWPATSAS